jgi:methylenetetrahydrofolate dehydrogenase (NADP+) / methenyltetrahydrofolate cyclohydrolase
MKTRILNGKEIAEFIQERQSHEVRSLKQAHQIFPKLAIIQMNDSKIISTYVRLKKRYGAEIGVLVDSYEPSEIEVFELIEKLNADDTVHGIIIQLPLTNTARTDELCDLVAPHKDVDALGKDATLDPATPMAILWLLAAYNVELRDKEIVIVGLGRLVGKPLTRMMRNSGLTVTTADRSVDDLSALTRKADIIITATGSPAILYADMIPAGCVVVDAGVAGEDGKTVGDVAPDVYERDDISLTPQKGGVGPLTVCALFDNVLRTARG